VQAHPPKILILKNLIRYFSFTKPAPPSYFCPSSSSFSFSNSLPNFFVSLFPIPSPDSCWTPNFFEVCIHSPSLLIQPTFHMKNPKHTHNPNPQDPSTATPSPPLTITPHHTMDFPLPTLPLNTPSHPLLHLLPTFLLPNPRPMPFLPPPPSKCDHRPSLITPHTTPLPNNTRTNAPPHLLIIPMPIVQLPIQPNPNTMPTGYAIESTPPNDPNTMTTTTIAHLQSLSHPCYHTNPLPNTATLTPLNTIHHDGFSPSTPDSASE